MPRSILVFFLACAIGDVASSSAQNPIVELERETKDGPVANGDEVAGRTIEQCVADLADDDRVVRLRALRTLAAFGGRATKPLVQTLGHSDAAMRYLAAVAIGDIAGRSDDPADENGNAKQATTTQLRRVVADDPSLAVQNAAAYALCRIGLVDEFLPPLVASLSYPERGMVCSTAELIGKIGPSASGALESLSKIHSANRPGGKGDYHIGGATMNAIRKIQQVPH